MPRAPRRCSRTGCDKKMPCKTHRPIDTRPGPRQRGYDSGYERERDEAVAGKTHCPRCGEPYTPGNPATGGHVKAIREGGTTGDGVVDQCRTCNYGWRRTGL